MINPSKRRFLYSLRLGTIKIPKIIIHTSYQLYPGMSSVPHSSTNSRNENPKTENIHVIRDSDLGKGGIFFSVFVRYVSSVGVTFSGDVSPSHEPGMQSVQSCSHDLHLITHVPFYAAYAGKDHRRKMIGGTVKLRSFCE